MCADPESSKKRQTTNLTVYFALSGSAHIKAARRQLMKLTPDNIASVTGFDESMF